MGAALMSTPEGLMFGRKTLTFGSVCSSVLILLLGLSAPLSGQSTAARVVADQTNQTNVDEVSLDVVVRSNKNKYVSDLKPQDLLVTDNGTRVNISDLHLVSGTEQGHFVAFVIDRLDSSAASNARSIAGKIMKEFPADGFSFAVLGIAGRLRLYQNFTGDRKLLSDKIRAATEASREEATNVTEAAEKSLLQVTRTGADNSGVHINSEQRALAQSVLYALQDSQKIMQEQHTRAALAGLLALARAEGKVPGRKLVIYFSQQTREDGTEEDTVGNILGAANRSGVSICAVDANIYFDPTGQALVAGMALGNSVNMTQNMVSAAQPLTGPPAVPQGDASAPGMAAMISNQTTRIEIRQAEGKEPLAILGYGTGGSFIAAGQNPRKIAQDLVRDLSTYYQVSYVPPFKEYDGKFRAVAIKPTRKDLRVRTRAGYFAVAPQNSASFKLFETPLLKVFSEPQLPSNVKLYARVAQLGDVGTADSNALAIEVPISELNIHDDPNTNLYSFHASIVAQIKNSKGEVVEHFSEDLRRHGSMDGKDAARNSSVVMQRHFVAEPGNYILEAVVADRNTDKVGAVRTPFTISATSETSLSDLTLVQRMEPLPDDLDANDPMKYGDRRVVPNLVGHMQRGVKQIDLFSVVHAAPQADQHPRLELTVLRNREAIAQVPLQLRPLSASAAVPYVASLQSGSLPPGDYQLIEALTSGEKTIEKSVAFRIEGPEIATATSPTPGIANSAPTSDELSMMAAAKMQGGNQQVVIATLPEGSVPPPSAEELNTIVESARKQSLAYSKTLPNFVCVQTTNRSVDQSGNGEWKHRDTLAELLRHVEGTETRTMLERNGERTTIQRDELPPDWAISKGEFGVLLKLVFNPASKTEFQWKGAATLGGAQAHVLSYRVFPKYETMVLRDPNGMSRGVGFHGLAYIDAATGGTRRITMEADDVPQGSGIRGASITVDYDYVTIGAHEYLMPFREMMMLRVGKKQIDLNEIAFRGYRRYASQTKILSAP